MFIAGARANERVCSHPSYCTCSVARVCAVFLISIASSTPPRPHGKREISSHVRARCGALVACNGCASLLRSPLSYILRKRMIDVPLFTSTFRRPRLCYHMTDVMSRAVLARSEEERERETGRSRRDRDSLHIGSLSSFFPPPSRLNGRRGFINLR